MKIISKIINIENNKNNISSDFIMEKFLELKIIALRWSLVFVSDKIIKVSVAYIKH